MSFFFPHHLWGEMSHTDVCRRRLYILKIISHPARHEIGKWCWILLLLYVLNLNWLWGLIHQVWMCSLSCSVFHQCASWPVDKAGSVPPCTRQLLSPWLPVRTALVVMLCKILTGWHSLSWQLILIKGVLGGVVHAWGMFFFFFFRVLRKR